MKVMKKIMATGLALIMVTSAAAVGSSVKESKASTDVVPYISFGANLKDSEKKTVMELLDVSSDELEDYKVIETTNEEEHK